MDGSVIVEPCFKALDFLMQISGWAFASTSKIATLLFKNCHGGNYCALNGGGQTVLQLAGVKVK